MPIETLSLNDCATLMSFAVQSVVFLIDILKILSNMCTMIRRELRLYNLTVHGTSQLDDGI